LALGTTVSFLSVSGTKAFTLADGTLEGELKVLICTVAASTPVGVVTPNATAGAYATITFGVVGQSATLMWTGSGWAVIGRQSGATAAAGAVSGLAVLA
jgi:hypothetical protein